MTGTSRLVSHLFWEPKHGHSFVTMEDAAWPPLRVGPGGLTGRRTHPSGTVRLALADGATESVFARAWAWALARAFASGELDVLTEPALAAAKGRWDGAVKRALARLERTPGGVPWFLEQKLEHGAYSTLLGVRLEPADGGHRYTAIGVGDSCLVELGARDEVRQRFPLSTIGEFAQRPVLLATGIESNRAALERQRSTEGWLGARDSLLLASDAFAAWLYEQAPSGDLFEHFPVLRLDAGQKEHWSDFRTLVHDERAAGRLRNDDVVFMRIEVERTG